MWRVDMAYTLDIALALGAAQTGLTLEAQLIDSTGANVGAAVTTGFYEVGVGNYLWHYAAFPDGFRGGVVFQISPGGAIMSFLAMNPEEAEYLDVPVSSRCESGTGEVTVVSPVAVGGDLSLIRCDDYLLADDRALEWTSDSWPDLSGATITFCVGNFEKAMTAPVPSGDDAIIRLELTDTETCTFCFDEADFCVRAELASGNVVTLVTGTLTMSGCECE